jgi:hypothetical protein
MAADDGRFIKKGGAKWRQLLPFIPGTGLASGTHNRYGQK